MAEPTEKSPQIEGFLEENFGRTTAITNDRCLDPPIGCGGPADKFDDLVSEREYRISGLCQKCQDEVFGGAEDEDDAISPDG